MTELEGNIKFWESILKNRRFMMAISTIAIVKSTIKHLKQLQEIEEEKHGAD